MGQDGQGKLGSIAAVVTIVAGAIAIWQFVLPMIGLGPVPTAAPQPTQGPQPSVPAFSFVPATVPPAGGALAAPGGLQLTGNCTDGFVLTWQPVPGASRYRIESDGDFVGTETQAVHEFQAFPDGKVHRFTVITMAFPAPDSPPSDPVSTPPCSF